MNKVDPQSSYDDPDRISDPNRISGQPARGASARRPLAHPRRGAGDAFEWREGEREPPEPRYDSHRLDTDGGDLLDLRGSALR